MRSIYIVGTLHGGLTPKNELEEILIETKPEQILVELTDNEVATISNSNSIRDEMIYVYQWAKDNNYNVGNFDVDINVLRDGFNGKGAKFIELSDKFGEELKKNSWKDLNKEAFWRNSEISSLDKRITEEYMSQERLDEREKRMLDIINNLMIENGKVLIFVGMGHLSYFEKGLPSANFLFR